jgi:hypothetical protein
MTKEHERPQPEAGGAVDDPRQDHLTARTDPETDDLPPGVHHLADVLAELAAILPGLKAALERQADNRPRIEPLALRLDELAHALGVSRRIIERERSAGRFPQADLHIGRCPLWRIETVKSWLERGDG